MADSDSDATVTVRPAEMDLYDRLTEVLGTRDVHPEIRGKIQDAYATAATWDELPPDIQALIIEAEKLPRQSWDDPADVPDNLDDL